MKGKLGWLSVGALSPLVYLGMARVGQAMYDFGDCYLLLIPIPSSGFPALSITHSELRGG